MSKLVLMLLVFLLDSMAHAFKKASQESLWLENGRILDSKTIFDVTKFKAKGDGKTDDSTAFQHAWLAACKVKGSTVLVPKGHIFLVGPMTLSGPCASTIILQVDGTVKASTNVNAWKSNPEAWITFEYLHGLTLQGRGVFDGQGAIWWKKSYRPLALMIAKSTNIKVTGITIKDSGLKHLKVFACVDVKIFSMNIVAPGNSPQTDGINLADSQQIRIHDINVAVGDDCISILGGSKDIEIYKVNCGPSHGISIGGLGRDGSEDNVSDINVHDSRITDSMFGVRIKSFQGGRGLVQGIHFSGIELTRVESAIIIDQYYCNGGHNCKNSTSSGVQISGVTYHGIKGTYIQHSINLLCSDPYPCKGLEFANIGLKPSNKEVLPICHKANGKIIPPVNPSLTCLNK